MTYPDDPNLRRPHYGSADARYGAGSWIGGLVALLIIAGLIVWATGVGQDAQVADTAPAVLPETTGKGITTGVGPITPPAPEVVPPAQPR